MTGTSRHSIYHGDFQLRPYWWDAYEPQARVLAGVPRTADVAIVGAGYAGLSAALELARQGRSSVVFDAEQPGFGGSTRNGGIVSDGSNVGRRYTREGPGEARHVEALRRDAAHSFDLVRRLIHDHNIPCGWHETGLFHGAWCRRHYRAMEARAHALNRVTPGAARMVPRDRQREEIGSDYYHGGMVTERAAHLHPALYFKGLLDLCQKTGTITICARAPVTRISRGAFGSSNGEATASSTGEATKWLVETARGVAGVDHVVIATNGYTGPVTPVFQKRVVPMASYMIATEELPPDLAASISPKNRSISDSRRILSYYRMSPDGRHLLYGGRAKFGFASAAETAPLLHRFMTERFPQLKDTKITHAWTGNVAFTMDEVPHMGQLDGLYYALGCNGSGVAMMTWLGYETARKIAGVANYACAFDGPDMPTHPLYNGRPWFTPWVGRYFQVRDWLDRHLDR